MSSFIVEGGHRLEGAVEIQGAKNEALEVICATLLTDEKVTISNLPVISDVTNLISMLAEMGVKVKYNTPSECEFQADDVNLDYIRTEEYRRKAESLRGSVMVLGPMVARFGVAALPKPGGDKIGRRRLDTHFIGLHNLGAEFEYLSERRTYNITAPQGLKGTYMLLDEASVTGTANIIMAAVLSKGETVIYNAGVRDLGLLPQAFERLGINVVTQGDDIRIDQRDIYEIDQFIDGSVMTVADAPWPGLSPDLISILLVVAAQARGSVLIHQKMFESRLFFVDKLIDMGARIILCDPHRAVVIGAGKFNCLRATDMVSPDIRAGIAMLIAALGAKGTSHIQNINQIDRGYQNIDVRLNKLGAKIIRIDE